MLKHSTGSIPKKLQCCWTAKCHHMLWSHSTRLLRKDQRLKLLGCFEELVKRWTQHCQQHHVLVWTSPTWGCSSGAKPPQAACWRGPCASCRWHWGGNSCPEAPSHAHPLLLLVTLALRSLAPTRPVPAVVWDSMKLSDHSCLWWSCHSWGLPRICKCHVDLDQGCGGPPGRGPGGRGA